MSEPNLNNDPMLSPEREARSQRIRKVLAGFLIGATTVGAVLLVIALMQHNAQTSYDSGVVIRIDNTPREAHFDMMVAPGEEPAKDGILKGPSLGHTVLTTNKDVRTYYDGLLADTYDGKKGNAGGLSGDKSYIDEEKGSLALFYTFYLENSSASEEQIFRIECKLNQPASSLPKKGSGARAYDFLRLGLYLGELGADDDQVFYYAADNTDFPIWGSDTDYRETLRRPSTREDEDGHTHRYATDFDPKYLDADGNPNGYCDSFVPGIDGTGLFDLTELKIPAGATKRVTFLAYLDGQDPDSYKELPTGEQTLSFSLHIGV